MTDTNSTLQGNASVLSPARREDRVSYEEFKALVREAGERRARQGGLIPIPELWRHCEAALPRSDFDHFVVSLDSEGLVHLLSHVDTASLGESVREDCLKHPTGPLLYWIRWL
jgi:hypothetical protein